ncbi:hypothetical protein niasHS_008082 [Heterodera schachtii]|uniref:Uncharacterized protein n=1 Tax=Heterodera schachtii TaxID=97005 RepID=A0ABD2J7K4_HETSC
MNSFKFIFVSSIALILAPDFSSGLKCKFGRADYVNDQSLVRECPRPTDEYCLAFTCRQDEFIEFIFWGCSVTPEKDVCENDAKELTERALKKKNISCQCQFGEKGKELDNTQFVLPPLPPVVPQVPPEELEKRLRCKIGAFSDEGYGMYAIMFCGEADMYCFAASCFIDNQLVDFWGCAPSNNCTFFGNQCHYCMFGDRNVQVSNLKLIVPTFLKEEESIPALASTTSTTTASTTTSSTTTASSTTSSTTTASSTTSSTTTASTTTTTKAVPLTDNAGNKVSNGMTDSSSRATVNIYFEEMPIPSGNGSGGNAGIFWLLLIALAFLCLV